MFPFSSFKPLTKLFTILLLLLITISHPSYYINLTVSPALCIGVRLNSKFHNSTNSNQNNDAHNSYTDSNNHQPQIVARNLILAPPLPATTTTQQPPVEVPNFVEPIGNHTAALGRNVELSCKIDNLGKFRTAWLRVEDKGILTIHNNTITRNYRISVLNNEDGKNFVLTIKNVQPSDKGGYMCQINSVPMKYAIGYLDVLTPPVFDDSPPPAALIRESGSTDVAATTLPSQQQQQQQSPAGLVTVNEGSNATLSCRATGNPLPDITWRREDNEPIFLNGLQTSEGLPKVEGSSIQLASVSRLNSGAYLCIASNGVQPSASKRQTLDVQFSPVIRLPQTDLSATLQQTEAKLNCFVELRPLGTYHWVKLASKHPHGQSSHLAADDDDLSLIEHDELTNSDKFEIVMKQVNSEKVLMILNVRHIERPDFGWYKCIARNSLGIQSSSIRLYESSSFSLNSMFRGGGGGGNGATQTDSTEQIELDKSQQQNDQQQQQDGTGSSSRGQTNKGSFLSRAHTRSSWINRSGMTGRSQDSTGNSPIADTSLADSASSASSSLVLLLLSHHILLMLINCILLIATAAQVVFTVQV